MDSQEVPVREGEQEAGEKTAAGFINKLSDKWHNLSPEKRAYYTQLGLVVAVQAVDAITTMAALQTHAGSETNPVVQFLLNNGGFTAMALAKLGFGSAQVLAYEGVRKFIADGEPTFNNYIRVSNALFTAVCVSNAMAVVLAR